MIKTSQIVSFCNQRVLASEITDFPSACNGLQIQNDGEVSKIGAAVDAGLATFQSASKKEIDFLIVHHGIFWSPPIPLTGVNYQKIKHCLDSNLSVYGSHLPLDRHPEIGNNAILARKIGLKPYGTFLPYEGNDIGLLTTNSLIRAGLHSQLKKIFPSGIIAMEFGSNKPEKVAILTGSGQSAVDKIIEYGSDTLVTGELKQQHFNMAQELKLNLYVCGHYATETFGVDALAKEVSHKFNLPYEFINTKCPL